MDKEQKVLTEEQNKENTEKDTAKNSDEPKRFKIMGVELVYLYIFGIIIAFVGWAAENMVRLINHGYIDSRFHLLPFISPYALIVFAFHIALRDPDELVLFGKKIFKEKTKKTVIYSNIISYFAICAFVFLGELAVGNFWELTVGVKLWDYHAWPLNVTQYTSVVSTFGFGTGAYLIFRFIYKPFLNFIRTKMNYKVAKFITLTLGMLIIIDTCIMMVRLGMSTDGRLEQYWKLVFFAKK